MRLHHICIQTDRYEESLKFYKEVLGFTLIKETPGFHSRAFNTWLKQDDWMIELQTKRANEKLIAFNNRNKGIVHLSMLVDDIEAEYLRIKSLGCNSFKTKTGQDIYEVENSKLFKLVAPEGTIIEIRDQVEI